VTYAPMQRGSLYLAAIVGWATRKVLAWRLSNPLDTELCVDALTETIGRYGPPQIMNTDQGSQFTSWSWTGCLRQAGIQISMDGKGRFLDNIFVERFWRSLKYECVYLHAWNGGGDARRGLDEWIDFYNRRRPHTALAGRTPNAVYWQHRTLEQPDQQGRSVA
jgi:putative transposase